MTRDELQAKFAQLDIPHTVLAVGTEGALAVDRSYWGLINDYPSIQGLQPQPTFTPTHAVWLTSAFEGEKPTKQRLTR